jgi:hypothetical protein
VTRPSARHPKAITVSSRYNNARPRELVAVVLHCTRCDLTWPAQKSRGGDWTAGGIDRQVRGHRCPQP